MKNLVFCCFTPPYDADSDLNVLKNKPVTNLSNEGENVNLPSRVFRSMDNQRNTSDKSKDGGTRDVHSENLHKFQYRTIFFDNCDVTMYRNGKFVHTSTND